MPSRITGTIQPSAPITARTSTSTKAPSAPGTPNQKPATMSAANRVSASAMPSRRALRSGAAAPSGSSGSVPAAAPIRTAPPRPRAARFQVPAIPRPMPRPTAPRVEGPPAERSRSAGPRAADRRTEGSSCRSRECWAGADDRSFRRPAGAARRALDGREVALCRPDRAVPDRPPRAAPLPPAPEPPDDDRVAAGLPDADVRLRALA